MLLCRFAQKKLPFDNTRTSEPTLSVMFKLIWEDMKTKILLTFKDSEDDPERLWCICQQPHGNKFMISCDGCKDWFHGKCVGITKKMGQDMEESKCQVVYLACEPKKLIFVEPYCTFKRRVLVF
jgi:hypothetical protein